VSERVFIIGPGHVGRGLARAFRASGIEVVGLHGKRPSGVATSTGALPKELAAANVVVLSVRDPQLDETLDEVIAKSDVLILCAPHAAYKQTDFKGKPVFDVWGELKGANVIR